MHVEIEELSAVEKKLAIEIPWEEVRVKLDRAYKELSSQVTINGFRKGKVPRAVLEQRFGKHVRTEVTKELVQESLIQAAEEHKIDAVAEPRIEGLAELKLGEGFKYSARIEVRAPIELKEYEGLAATRVRFTVTDEEVDKALERKRVQHTEYRPIEGRTETAATDALIIAVKGKVGDHPIDRPETHIDLGDARLEPLPGLAKALTGVAIDAKELELRLEIPGDDEHKEVAGEDPLGSAQRGAERSEAPRRTAEITVTIKDARQKVVPALDDEFAKDTGEADTLDELRGKLRAQLEKVARDRADREMREGLVKELVAKNPTEVAPALIERGIDSQIQRARLSLAMQGVDLDQTGVDLQGMRDRLRAGAAEEIRGQLLLEALADKSAIEITDADVDAKINELAVAQGKRPAKVKGEMLKEGTLDTLRWRLRQEKALDLLASRATISEIDPPAPAAPEPAEPSEEK